MKLEDLIALSRPQALAMQREILEREEDCYDIGLAEGVKLVEEPLVYFEQSKGCVFADLDACGIDGCKITTDHSEVWKEHFDGKQ